MADILFNISNINELISKVRHDSKLYMSCRNFEDNIAKFFEIDKKTSVLDMNFPLLWNFDSESLIIPYTKAIQKSPDIYNYLLEHFTNLKIDIKINNGFVICGKILESITDQISAPNSYDIFIYDSITHSKFNDLIKNGDYMFEVKPDHHVKIHKKLFSSPVEILININKYTNRICFDCRKQDFFATVMFYLDLDKLCNSSDNDIVRANIFFKIISNRVTKFGQFHKIVNSMNIDELRNLQSNSDFLNNPDFEILDDEGITPIERALRIYFSLENPLLKKNMKDIIDVLCGFNYRRPPFIFAYAMLQQMITKIDLSSLYDSLNLCVNRYGLLINGNSIKLNSSEMMVSSINTFVVRELLYQNNVEDIIDFLKYINYKDFDHNILLAGNDILRILLPKIYTSLNSRYIYEIVLRSEMVDIFNAIGKPMFHDNFIKIIVPQLLENSCYISLLYLIKMQYPIFKIKYSKPLLHFIADSKLNITENDCEKVIKFFYKYSNDLSYFIHTGDKNGDTFMHRLSINKPNLIPFLLNMSICKDVDIKSFIKLQSKNKNGDTFLHSLVRKKYIDIVRQIIDIIKPIIDLQNNNGETALIISARNNDETFYSLLKKIGANDSIKDKYGNTVYHYICMNEMFIGSVIIETCNEYGYKPSYYTVLNNYWKFKDLTR